MVLVGLRIIWRLATSPTRFFTGSTTDGVTFRPVSAAGITFGEPPSITATQLLVVPRSIPIILFDILFKTLFNNFCLKYFYLGRTKHILSYFISFENQFCNSVDFFSDDCFRTFVPVVIKDIPHLGRYAFQAFRVQGLMKLTCGQLNPQVLGVSRCQLQNVE